MSNDQETKYVEVETVDGVDFCRKDAFRDIPLWRRQPQKLLIETWLHPGRKAERPLRIEMTAPYLEPTLENDWYWDILHGHQLVSLSWLTCSEPFAISGSLTLCKAKCLLESASTIFENDRPLELTVWRLCGWEAEEAKK